MAAAAAAAATNCRSSCVRRLQHAHNDRSARGRQFVQVESVAPAPAETTNWSADNWSIRAAGAASDATFVSAAATRKWLISSLKSRRATFALPLRAERRRASPASGADADAHDKLSGGCGGGVVVVSETLALSGGRSIGARNSLTRFRPLVKQSRRRRHRSRLGRRQVASAAARSDAAATTNCFDWNQRGRCCSGR